MSAINFRVKYDVRTTIDRVLVTPEIAEYILKVANGNNRNISKATVDSYVNDIWNGAWKDNGERVKFGKDGNLRDGQHRLSAIVKSGVAMELDMVFGLDDDIIGTFDRQRPRTNGDDYNIKYGTKNGNVLMARARGIRLLFNSHRTKMSFSLIDTIAADFSEGLRITCDVVTTRSGIGRANVMAAFAIAAEARPVKVRTALKELRTASLKSQALQKLAAYLNSDTSDNADTVGKKTLFALWADLTNHDFQKLLTTRHEEVLQYFVDEIEKKHALCSLDRV
jgi:hypothetical protein